MPPPRTRANELKRRLRGKGGRAIYELGAVSFAALSRGEGEKAGGAYGGMRNSLQLLARKATAICEGERVSFCEESKSGFVSPRTENRE